jgi:hypothetical protein
MASTLNVVIFDRGSSTLATGRTTADGGRPDQGKPAKVRSDEVEQPMTARIMKGGVTAAAAIAVDARAMFAGVALAGDSD